MRVLAQPARRSDRTVEQHFQDTIVRPVDFNRHTDLLDASTHEALQRLFPSGTAQMWGVMPGKNGSNLPEIRKMSPGDWVFFSGDKHLYLGGTVALAWRNPRLAARLWGTDGSDTWEYMYALSGTKDFDIPIDELRELLGWKPNRNIMRFQAFAEGESGILQERYSLSPVMSVGPVAEETSLLPGLHSDSASRVDLLDNGSDVDMLAKLAMARITSPPLAIALLGEWGAGKSSFIDQMSRRVDELAVTPAGSPAGTGAFSTTVHQVHFNAWHYSDDNVWPGLAERLFEILAPEPEPEPETPASQPSAERERRAAQLSHLETEQRELDAELDRAEKNRPRGFLGSLRSPVEGARLLYTAVRLGTRDITHGWLHLVGWLALIGGTLLTCLWLSSLPTALLATSAAVIAGPAMSFWGVLRRCHSKGLSLTNAIRSSLEKRQQAVRDEITASRARLAEIDAAVRLSDFLTERGASYEKARGLLGSVHRDLSDLDKKLRAAHAEWAGSGSNQKPPLERIILYIDDLDRCAPSRVVEVLAAVHLMLALPLFVVVVAVDPRWLLRSLEHHYSELFSVSDRSPHTTDTLGTATPLDYLDKIFQIPFVVPPVTPEKTARLITALLEAPEATSLPGPVGVDQLDDAGREEDPADPPASQDESAPTRDETEAHREDPVQLRLLPQEVRFMSRVGSLTQTPRAAKKLVNLYRLVRIGVPGGDLVRFEGSADAPGEHQVVQTLLALLVGDPHHAVGVFRAVMAASPNSKITDVLNGMPPSEPAGPRIAELIDQINADTPTITDTAIYQAWCPRLARFSFYTRNLAG
ncbi:P-loop NTPase fold protein [Streptomyces sp. NPDC049954]|uniref:KAP family P-loop NTPase fold protein n=1 Tax=Streptomyces sp. NPDC049954 TaxID=3155779 RepID=UPI003427B77B